MPLPVRRRPAPPCTPRRAGATMGTARNEPRGSRHHRGVPHDGGGDAHQDRHTMRSDAQLILAACTSEAAFRQLYDRYAERVHRYHLRRTGDEEAALDLTAETFAQAWISRQ